MRNHHIRMLGLAAAAVLLATSAQAQGKSQGKGKGHEKGDRGRGADQVVEREGTRDTYGNGVKVPPGLAKKPGQMPPGQYKKRYGTNEGATVLGDILRRRGYSVLRVVPAGESQYVYYRLNNGTEQRAIVSPGTERLVFRNVPPALVQEVLAKLY
jgi:hypothetical protein